MASIRKIEKTGHWEAQIFLGKHPETGKARFVTKTCDNKKEADVWVNKMEVQKDEGLYRPSLARATLAGYLMDTWLPMYRTQVRSTYTIEMVLGKWICRPQPETPFLGSKLLRKLTNADFTKLYAAMAEKRGMQRRGIEQVHSLLRRALKSAVDKHELPRNPTDGATLPKPNVRAEILSEADEQDAGEVQSLDREQAMRFLEAAAKDRFSVLWLLLFNAALRPGEAFALKWRHIDWERGVVVVRTGLTRVRNEERKKRGQGWMITDPKTESSKDDVPITASTLMALKRWKVQQNKDRLALGDEWQDHGFVFTTPFGAPLGNNMGRAWRAVLREADGGRGDLGTWGPEPEKPSSGSTAKRSFTPNFVTYVLRHTRLTLMYEDTGDILAVSRFARHKNVAITSRFYVHTKAVHTKQRADESFNRLTATAS